MKKPETFSITLRRALSSLPIHFFDLPRDAQNQAFAWRFSLQMDMRKALPRMTLGSPSIAVRQVRPTNYTDATNLSDVTVIRTCEQFDVDF